jgi:alcohol dehydrogenase YqhD (iron-dependent ADH family)
MSSTATLEAPAATASAVNSFSIYTPTRIFFGADQLTPFAAAAAKLGKKAFLVTGGGTVERLGYLKEVTDAFTSAGVSIVHFSGIEPNPESSTIDRATELLRKEKAEFVIALGGGSAMDAAKSIAALAVTDEPDIWPFVIGESRAFQLQSALPIVAIPTTAATASEVTPYAVISNRAAKGKSILIAEFLKPHVAWLNPVFTIGLSPTTTRDGAADILSHTFESYLLGGDESLLADRYSEGVMSTVIEMLPRLLENPTDLLARGNIMWASTLALNDYQLAGRRPSEFVLHSLEHSLSGFSPELAHGRGLATLYPSYFRWLVKNGRAIDRLAQLGTRLFGLTGTEADRANGYIDKFETWLKDNGLYQSLGDLGFNESDYPAIAEYCVRTYGDGKQINALGPLPVAEIIEIFRGTERQSDG